MYKKVFLKNVPLNFYPVYTMDVNNGRTPLKVVGIRNDSVELSGDDTETIWYDSKNVFAIKKLCEEEIKPSGCQERNVYCCGGGSLIREHEDYFDELIE